MKNIEAEKDELVLQNESGTYAIIPANKREEVKRLLSEGCYDCIDRIVESLPKASDYAQDGTTIDPIYYGGIAPTVTVGAEAPNWLKFKREYEQSNSFDIEGYVNERFNNPRGRQAIDKIDSEQFRQDLYNEAKRARNKELNTYVADKLLQQIPQNNQSRVEYLNQFIDKEQQIIKQVYPKYSPSLYDDTKRGLSSLVERSPLDTFNNILNSKDYTDAEKRELLQDYIDHPVMSKLGDAAKILSPLAVPSKMVQSAYKDDYTMQDALQGRKNDAGIVEDIVTDPLNLVGLGIWSNLSKTGKFSKLEDAYQAVKGLSKEEAISKLSSSVDDVSKSFKSDVGSIDYRKNPLLDKKKEAYEWFYEQLRFDKLPQTTNKQSIEVLDNFKQRIRTTEGQKRLKELGITEEQLLQDLQIVEDPNTYGYYTAAKNKIAINPNHPLPKKVVRHEIEHGVQNALRQSKINKVVEGTTADKLKASQSYTTEIDDILSKLTLRKEETPNKKWKGKAVYNEPIQIDDYKDLISNKQNATDYFLTGSDGKEKSAFLGEVQQYMMDIGKIPKDSYVQITPEMVKETMIDAMFDEVGGGKYLRLFNIIKPEPKNYEIISKALNKMLSITPYIGIGGALEATSQTKNNKIKAADGLVIDPPADIDIKLLDTIGTIESNNYYDILFGGKRNPQLTDMSISELLDYQRNLVNEQKELKKTKPNQYVGSAAGRYQFIPDTIKSLVDQGIISLDDKFNSETQDKMAIQLLNESGLNRYKKGEISAEEFADNLSKKWAGLPYNNDKSYYDKDGVNKALISRKDFMQIFENEESVEQESKEDVVEPVEQVVEQDVEQETVSIPQVQQIQITGMPQISSMPQITGGYVAKEKIKGTPELIQLKEMFQQQGFMEDSIDPSTLMIALDENRISKYTDFNKLAQQLNSI